MGLTASAAPVNRLHSGLVRGVGAVLIINQYINRLCITIGSKQVSGQSRGGGAKPRTGLVLFRTLHVNPDSQFQ